MVYTGLGIPMGDERFVKRIEMVNSRVVEQFGLRMDPPWCVRLVRVAKCLRFSGDPSASPTTFRKSL